MRKYVNTCGCCRQVELSAGLDPVAGAKDQTAMFAGIGAGVGGAVCMELSVMHSFVWGTSLAACSLCSLGRRTACCVQLLLLIWCRSRNRKPKATKTQSLDKDDVVVERLGLHSVLLVHVAHAYNSSACHHLFVLWRVNTAWPELVPSLCLR
jgi:hypothetical protein